MIHFSEQFTIGDLEKNAVSDLTAGFLWDREHGKGHNRTILRIADVRSNNLYAQYRSDPTYHTAEPSKRVVLNGASMSTDYYDTLLEFADVETHCGDPETFATLSPVEQREVVRDFLEQGMCRVHCNCPAFYYTGAWEDMEITNSTIFSFPGPKGTGAMRALHSPGLKMPEVRICKHVAAAIHMLQGSRDLQELVKTIQDRA